MSCVSQRAISCLSNRKFFSNSLYAIQCSIYRPSHLIPPCRPQEALGINNLDSMFKLKSESSTHCLQSLDISSCVPSLTTSSMIHPSCSFFHPFDQPVLNTLTLETCPTPPVKVGLSWSVVHTCILELLQNYRAMKHLVFQPTWIPEFHRDDWVDRMMDVLQSEDWYSDAVGAWMVETYRVTHQWKESQTFFDTLKAFRFLLQLPIEIRYQINSWQGLHKAMVDVEDYGSESLESLTRLSLNQIQSIKKKKQPIPRLQEGNMAVIRTSARDIELIPPNPNM